MGKLSFGTAGIAYQVDQVQLKTDNAPKCERCKVRVYFNEEKKAHGKYWHQLCFTCFKCKKRLDSTNSCEHEGEVYCTVCHKRQFGPRGYGFVGAAAGLSTESTYNNVRPVEAGVHTQTVSQCLPKQNLDPSSLDCCPRCGSRVYFAEEVKALRRKWHKLCFKCIECSKLLDPNRCATHQGELFCQACYGRRHGPKGNGFAGGSGSLMFSEPVPLKGKVLETVNNKTGPRPSNIVGQHEWTDAVSM